MNKSEQVLEEIGKCQIAKMGLQKRQVQLTIDAAREMLWTQHPNKTASKSLNSWLMFAGLDAPFASDLSFIAGKFAPFCEANKIEVDAVNNWSVLREAIPTLKRYILAGDVSYVRWIVEYCNDATRQQVRNRFRKHSSHMANHYCLNGMYVIIPKSGFDPSKIAEKLSFFSDLQLSVPEDQIATAHKLLSSILEEQNA